jgi:hypothetical protein
MNQTAQQQTENPIDFLSLRLFPAKLTIRAKAELLTDRKREEALAYIRDIDEFEAELSQLSPAALQALVDDENESDKTIAEEQAEQEENSRFFYDRSARADYIEWTKKVTWTVDEGTALLLGKDPAVVKWHSINPLVYKSKFAKRYADLRQLIKQAVESGELHESQTPAAYLLFAKSSGFALPAELEAMVTPAETKKKANGPAESAGDNAEAGESETGDETARAVSMFQNLLEQNREKLQSKEPEPEPQPEPAKPAEPDVAPDTILSMLQERETLLRMLGAMAIGGYGFEPGCDDKSITDRIVKDFRNYGLSANPVAAHKLIGDAVRLVASKKKSG